jgi:thioredoxin-like negative regulator of GroEL
VALLLIIPPALALLLRSSLAELLTDGFLRLVDPALHDHRPFDPEKNQRCLNAVARLIHIGRREEAILLGEQFKQSGDVDVLALETLLEFHGLKPPRAKISTPLAEAARLRTEGKFAEAETVLRSLLANHPVDAEAAMMLMRLYAEELRQPGRAHEILRTLEKDLHIAPSLLEFARSSIDEWSRPKLETKAAVVPPRVESVDELLAQGAFGTAIERLEEEIILQPQNFELRVKLAEVHAVHCQNLPRAEKIIRQIELDPDFKPPQVAAARLKLKAWRAT